MGGFSGKMKKGAMEGDLEEPLLTRPKPPMYADCPGCEVVHRHYTDDRVPYKELAVVALIVVVNSLPIASLYPFVYFMVEDFHIAKKKEDIGYYVGALGFAFMMGRCLTSVLWGFAADIWGRKPVIMIGIASVIVFGTGFGCSTNFWVALAMRFLLGGFNGMLATAKAYATEICSEKHQAIGISMVGTFWGFGLIIGPAMGGYLSQPAIKYPDYFPPGSLFDRFPYLLPSALTTLMAIGIFIICIDLPETLHKHQGKEPLESPSEKDTNGYASFTGCEATKAVQEADEEAVPTTPNATDVLYSNSRDVAVAPHTTEESMVVGEVATPLLRYKDKEEKPAGMMSSHPLWASIAVYCCWCFQDMAYVEIFSLWCVSPTYLDGLGFTTNDVGSILAISGGGMLIFQLLFFPVLANFLGPILIVRFGAGLSIPLMAILSLLPELHGRSLWIVLSITSILRFILTVATLTGSFILINNAVPQEQRGVANGISMSFASFFKAIGPALGGAIFAWAQNRNDAYILPGNQVVFFFLGVVALITVISTYKPILPEAVDHPYEEF